MTYDFGLYPYGTFTVDGWDEVVAEKTGWAVNRATKVVSSAISEPPIQLPVVDWPECAKPYYITDESSCVKDDENPIQVIKQASASDPTMDYQLTFPVPPVFLNYISGREGVVSIRLKVRFQEAAVSVKGMHPPKFTFDIGQWLSGVIVGATALRGSGTTWVYTAIMTGLTRLVPSAHLSCYWNFDDIKIYNTKFICDVELEGTYFVAFFDASLVPTPSLDLEEDGSDDDSSADSSAVGSDLVMV